MRQNPHCVSESAVFDAEEEGKLPNESDEVEEEAEYVVVACMREEFVSDAI